MQLPHVALAALVALSCSQVKEAPRQLNVPGSFLGYTQCTEVFRAGRRVVSPVSWLNENVYNNKAESDATIAHERVHKEQMRRFPSCRAAYQWYGDNIIEAEAEAYCASARTYHAAHQATITLDGAIWRYAKWLSRNYKGGTTHADAIAAIQEVCKQWRY